MLPVTIVDKLVLIRFLGRYESVDCSSGMEYFANLLAILLTWLWSWFSHLSSES